MNLNKVNIFVLIIMLFSIQTISTMRYNFYEEPEQTPQQKLNTTLLKAAQNGDIKEAQEAINQGAYINYREDGTPLFFAALNNHLNIVKLLIENGADINKGYTIGSTPLIVAAGQGNINIVKFLLDNGANPNLTYMHGINFPSMDAITIAKAYGHPEVANYIREYKTRRQKEIEKETPLPSVLVGLIEEYTGHKEPSKEVHE